MALDFPSSPVDGQVYNNFYYDADKEVWKSLSSGASPNYLVNPTITDAVVSATAPNSTTVPLTVNGADSQSANLQEWKNSLGTVISSVGANGGITNGSFDFKLGNFDQSSRGDSGYSRALVKINNSRLYINYAGDFTGGTVVDSALSVTGNLSTPSQPAFYAAGSGTITRSGTQSDYLIPFTTVDLNRGNCFNSSNYRFTAPVSGVYYFWMQSCTTDATSTGPEIYIFKNGSSYNNVSISYNSAFYNTFGGGYVISLNANDYVQMSVRNNNGTTFTIERGRSRFAGYLIG